MKDKISNDPKKYLTRSDIANGGIKTSYKEKIKIMNNIKKTTDVKLEVFKFKDYLTNFIGIFDKPLLKGKKMRVFDYIEWFPEKENYRYEVICFDGFGVWDIHKCRTRKIAREEKNLHKSLFVSLVPFIPQFPYIKIWDRKAHSWI